MRQINVIFPPRRQELCIVMPPKPHQADLWIDRLHEGTITIWNLAFKIGAEACNGILLGGQAVPLTLRMAAARGGIRLGAAAGPSKKRVSLLGRCGTRWGENAAAVLQKTAWVKSGVGLHVSAEDVKEAIVRKAKNGIALGTLATDAKKRSGAAIQNGVPLGQNAFPSKESSARAKAGTALGAGAERPPCVIDGRASGGLGVKLGALSTGDVVLRVLRPLSNIDDKGLSEMDEMTLGELDYYLIDEQ